MSQGLLILSGWPLHSWLPAYLPPFDGFISHTDIFSESYPSMDVRERTPTTTTTITYRPPPTSLTKTVAVV